MTLPIEHFEWQDRTLVLRLRVVPGASRDQVGGLLEGQVKVQIQARAVDGQANKRLFRFLAAQFDVRVRAISLLSGRRHRNKVVCIENPRHLPGTFQIRPDGNSPAEAQRKDVTGK